VEGGLGAEDTERPRLPSLGARHRHWIVVWKTMPEARR
jgi:hypothetical protein